MAQSEAPKPDISRLEKTYRAALPQAEALRQALYEELELVLKRAEVPLSFSLEGRVKTLPSLRIKAESLNIDDALAVHDLVGMRVVLQFRRDVEKVKEIIETTFQVVRKHDTAQRLGENRFGYASFHYIIKLKEDWLTVPRYAGLGQLQAEVQVRTTAQHIWAAASHILQYKHEDSVPAELRRSIFRVSALLETVDVEFDHLLSQRDKYRGSLTEDLQADRVLDVDVLEQVLDEVLPNLNKDSNEDYDQLLPQLRRVGITTVSGLKDVLHKGEAHYKAEESRRLNSELESYGSDREIEDEKRLMKGVFYTHIGLVRVVLRKLYELVVEV